MEPLPAARQRLLGRPVAVDADRLLRRESVLFRPQRNHGIDARGAARWNRARDDCLSREQRVRLLDRRGNLIHLGLRLLQRDTVVEARDHLKVVVPGGTANPLLGRDDVRKPDLRRARGPPGMQTDASTTLTIKMTVNVTEVVDF